VKKILFLISLLVSVGVGALLTYQFTDRDLVPEALAAPPEQIDVSRPSAILAVRSIGRLESHSMELEKIIEAGTWGGNVFQEAWYKDHMLFIANGTVIAGFDLKTLSKDSVVETDSMITVNLGKPKLLVSRIDNKKSRVYDRDVGAFNSADPHLESRTRARAEAVLRTAACEAGILQKAGEDGREVIQNLLEQIFVTANVDVTVNVTFETGRC